MSQDQSHTEQGQIERAKRLRDRIERLKHGQPEPAGPKKGKSLKQQISERTAEQNKGSVQESEKLRKLPRVSEKR